MELKKNHLYQFEVKNPYDGCWWCWEYMYYTNNREIHFLKFDGAMSWIQDLHKHTGNSHNGSFGINFNTERNCKRDLLTAMDTKESLYVYNLNSKKDIEEFITANNEHDMIGICKQLHNHYYIELYTICSKCECKQPLHSFKHTGYHGDGGIGVILTDFICDECYSLGTCGYCGEYYDKLDSEGNCEYCTEIECSICYENTIDVDEHSICETCQLDDLYIDSLQDFETRLKQYNAEIKEQQFFRGTKHINKPVFKLLTIS